MKNLSFILEFSLRYAMVILWLYLSFWPMYKLRGNFLDWFVGCKMLTYTWVNMEYNRAQPYFLRTQFRVLFFTFRDLVPIISTLEYNEWFTKISCDSFKLVSWILCCSISQFVTVLPKTKEQNKHLCFFFIRKFYNSIDLHW